MYALYSAVLGVGLLAYLPAFLARRRRAGYGRDLAQRLGRFGRRAALRAALLDPRGLGGRVGGGGAPRRGDPAALAGARHRGQHDHAHRRAHRARAPRRHRHPPLLPASISRARSGTPSTRRARASSSRSRPSSGPTSCAPSRARRIPAMIANGRISDRSFRRYGWVRGLMRRVLANVSVFAMQTEEDARRIIALGAPPARVVVTGNLKSDLVPDATGENAAAWRGAAPPRRGRARSGSRAAPTAARRRSSSTPSSSARAGCPELALLLAPRHPERVGEVEALIRERGLAAVRRSGLPADAAPGAVVILDTVGELAALYALAEVVFVGGSLVPIGGHNVLEPAMRGKPVLVGPHMSNFREGAELLQRSGGGLVVKDGPELERELARLLVDRRARPAHGRGRPPGLRRTAGCGERHARPDRPPPVAARPGHRVSDDPAPGTRGAAAPVLGRSGHAGGDRRPLRAQPRLPRGRSAFGTWPTASRSCAPGGCRARWSRSAISPWAAAARPRRSSWWCARCASWARCPRW